MNEIEMFKEIVTKMAKTYEEKNHDYGDSAHKTFEQFGLTSFLVRLSDKLNRAITLNKVEAKIKDEKIEDTLLDMANYCVMALIELRKEKEAKNIENKM